jgi:hypothetical protein
MSRLLALSALAAALLVTGCCGGYSVVRTTVLDKATVREGGQIENGTSSVLHFSRIGEPLSGGCKPGEQYADDLWIQVPSLQAGQSFTLGAPGVVVVYERQQNSAKIIAKSVTGTIKIGERNDDHVSVGVAVTITLPSGEVVGVDSEYDFHPLSSSSASPESARWRTASCPRQAGLRTKTPAL